MPTLQSLKVGIFFKLFFIMVDGDAHPTLLIKPIDILVR